MNLLDLSQISSFDHLASYILKSNRVSIYDLINELNFELRALPQIKSEIQSSLNLIQKDQSRVISGGKLCYITNGLEELYNPEFWNELIRLYLIGVHRYNNVFNLKYFDLEQIPRPLLTAIYCMGYNRREVKTKELSDYMEQLAKNNLKSILFKPSLSNAQALLLHIRSLNYNFKIVEGRACMLHLVRMCYTLGIHIDTDRFEDWINYNRRAVYMKTLEVNLFSYSVFKVFYKFEYEFEFNSQLYDESWQLLPKLILDKLKLNDEEAKLISIATVLSNKYSDQCMQHMIFSQHLPKSDDIIEDICLQKYYTLKKMYSKICKEFEILRLKFAHCLGTIELNHDLLTVFYSFCGLAILEFGRRNITSVNQSLIYKTIDLCFKGLEAVSNVKFNQYRAHNYYYVSITLISLIKYADQHQKQEMKSFFKILSAKFLNVINSESILPYLIYKYGEKQAVK
jgi:hypothetical protein